MKREVMELIQGILVMAGILFIAFAAGCTDCEGGYGWALFYVALASACFIAGARIEVKNV